MKKILGVYTAPPRHWVGDGFPVRTLFSYAGHGEHVSPFLMLDYAGPEAFPPGQRRRGVGEHPHRGFETVTIVYQGEVQHRDSSGGGGTILPGDVQWMTAASGILHDEFHSPEFTRRGGTLEMVQLWVNLPAKDKKAPAGYQSIASSTIPTLALPEGAGTVRVIAGDFAGTKGPAKTFTPIDVWDMRLGAGRSTQLHFAEGRMAAIVVLKGSVQMNSSQVAHAAQMILFDRADSEILIEAQADAVVLVLSGEPIDEPIVGYGPFVMNSEAEIRQAIDDFNSGRFVPQTA